MVTVAMYFLFQLGIQYSSATTASLGNYFGPVFAILFNVILLGESVTPVFIIGSVLVLTGVIITSGTRVLHEVRRWIHR
jgi:drug/metabolite transporter (DMT)-like permease